MSLSMVLREADVEAIPIGRFRQAMKEISVDVYIRIGEDNYAHVFSRTTGLDYHRLAQYIHRGVQHLYVRKGDLSTFESFMKNTAAAVIRDPAASTEKKVATLLNMTEQSLTEIFLKVEVDDETMHRTKTTVTGYVNLLINEPKTLAVILNLAAQGDYLYYHSIMVSIFSIFIAKAAGMFNPAELEIIGIGGFLHDIGCSRLPQEMLDSPSEYTADQWTVMRTHCKLGLEMLDGAKPVPEGAKFIVYQHHETPDGQGYPNGLKDSAIYYPAKVVAIADAFSALISNQPYRPAYKVPEALEILEKGQGKHDPKLVKLLAMIFRNQVKRSAA